MDFIDGHGASDFAAAVAMDTGAPTNDLTIVDMNGDGRPEVAGVADPYDSGVPSFRQLRIWTADAGGEFARVEDRATGVGLARVADDYAYDDGDLETYLGYGDGRLVVEECVASGSDISSLALRDLNHDGLVDIVALDASNFSAKFSGTSAWERHPQGDEIVQIVDGATTLHLMTAEGRQSVALSAGMMAVVPQNTWHQFEAPNGVCVMTATPQPTEHLRVDVEDPRTMG